MYIELFSIIAIVAKYLALEGEADRKAVDMPSLKSSGAVVGPRSNFSVSLLAQFHLNSYFTIYDWANQMRKYWPNFAALLLLFFPWTIYSSLTLRFVPPLFFEELFQEIKWASSNISYEIQRAQLSLLAILAKLEQLQAAKKKIYKKI